MINKKDQEEKDFNTSFSESIERLNKVMERLRARLFTLAEASLSSEQQASSFKKAVKDYTSDSWNDLTELINELENKDKDFNK
ncbi:MAG: hypothetical protein KAW92_10945 [Candidatus Cloacimonetes bacterium]|nr:hypothetical protein [Candidatus Cloacimonadota bacterium]